jgi:hypothetical protein
MLSLSLLLLRLLLEVMMLPMTELGWLLPLLLLESNPAASWVGQRQVLRMTGPEHASEPCS